MTEPKRAALLRPQSGPGSLPILITGSDEPYVPFADALIRSIRAQPQLDTLPIGLVDIGLNPQTRRAFEEQGLIVRQARWMLDFPAQSVWAADKPHFKAHTSKPFLPKLFPDFDPLLWIDADAWIQTAEGVLGLLAALQHNSAAMVLELDRSYQQLLHESVLWDRYRMISEVNFGSAVADRMHVRPVINSGLFALRRDEPLWRAWQNRLTETLQQPDRPLDQAYLFEQTSLNVAAYLDSRPGALLPATYNWSLYHAVPAWCPKRRLYVEPSPPHAPVHCLHLTGGSKRRDHRVAVASRPAQTFLTPLDYDGARLGPPKASRSSKSPASCAAQRPIIVTACDEPFARYARGLLRSLRQHRSLDRIPIGLIDLGLTDDTRRDFEDAGVAVVPGRWDLDFPAREAWDQTQRGNMALTAKAFLPAYFPGHDNYLWIDADVWVQSPGGVTDFFDALCAAPAAVVQELDRSYDKYLNNPEIWDFHASLVEDNFGPDVALKMHLRPVINAGIFAFRDDAPHWRLWKQGLARALNNHRPPFDKNHYFDQVALNVAVYEGKLPTAFLPAPYNWSLMEIRPRWCPERRLYVEPSPPYEPLRNLHQTGPSKDQAFKVRMLGSEATFVTTFDYDSARQNAP